MTEKTFQQKVIEQLDIYTKLTPHIDQQVGLPDLIGIHNGVSFYLELKCDETHTFQQLLDGYSTSVIDGTKLKHPPSKLQYYILLRWWENCLDQKVGILVKCKDCYFYATPNPDETNKWNTQRICEELSINKLLGFDYHRERKYRGKRPKHGSDQRTSRAAS